MPFAAIAQEQPQTLPEVVVRQAPGTPSSTETYQLPVTTESVTAKEMAETINVMNTEDALKYLPSLIVRKRNFGDQQAPLATRTSGLGQSARSLIYADGVLLSTLIGNNNSSASPRWALVAPEEIERIDVMYGPFSACTRAIRWARWIRSSAEIRCGRTGSVSQRRRSANRPTLDGMESGNAESPGLAYLPARVFCCNNGHDCAFVHAVGSVRQ